MLGGDFVFFGTTIVGNVGNLAREARDRVLNGYFALRTKSVWPVYRSLRTLAFVVCCHHCCRSWSLTAIMLVVAFAGRPCTRAGSTSCCRKSSPRQALCFDLSPGLVLVHGHA